MHRIRVQQTQLLNAQAWSRRAVKEHATSLVSLAAALCALALYSATLSTDLTWRNYGSDGGELITASMTLGIAHPPGYPLYIIIGRLVALLPVGTIAGRYALLSAVAGACAVGIAVHCMIADRPVSGHKIALALATGLALAVTPLLWGQATIAEVYTLYLLFVALFVWALRAERSALAIGLTFGLAVSGHLSGVLLAPLALWKAAKMGMLRFASGAAAGLAPFLLLPWLATGHSPVVWGSPNTLGSWWWLASARLYQPNVFGLPLNMWAPRLNEWLSLTILIPILLWLTVASLVVWRARSDLRKLPLAWLFTAFAFSIYAFTYRPDDAAVLFLPALLLAAIVAGRGLVHFDSPVGWLLPVMMFIVALSARPSGDGGSLRSAALAALARAPSDAVVLTPGDESISALWYFHYVEGVRPDVVVVDENMFQFPWYRSGLRLDHPDLVVPVGDDLGSFVAKNRLSRPVCRLSLIDQSSAECSGSASEAASD